MLNENQKLACELAKKIEWDTESAFEIAYELLTDCNMHTEANALREEHEKFLARMAKEDSLATLPAI